MSDDTVLKLSQPSTFSDPLTEVLRSGARSLLARAVEAEVAAFLDGHSEARTEEGRRRLVRHGHLPEREIMTGIGPVAVRAPRVRDRTGQGAERIRFSSALLPPYARRSKSLEVLIPVLYLKGISTGDFAEALAALLGPDAGGLSASTVARLTEVWADEHAHWLKRDLSARHYVYFWADGIHVQARLEDDAQCLLVIIGATPEGKKELVGLIDGVRESAQSWRELLLDLKRRGLAVAPELAIADGALGFWKAIEEVWPRTRSQRCWVHKTANVLNKLPKSRHSKAKRALQEIWMAETRNHADSAFDAFIETYAVKYDKAAACLVKDRETMLAFYDFPAEHWKHLRTTNPIESTFATVRHPGRRARQHRVFVAPVELAGLARIEDQRHIGLGRRQQPVPAPPDPGIAAHRVVAALIAQRRKVFMNPQQRQPIPARLLLVGLQLALELIHPRSKLRHRLDLALVAVRGLIAPHHLAHRVLRNPQIPGDRLDRNAPHQMIPTDPCDRFHYQHLPLTSSVQ